MEDNTKRLLCEMSIGVACYNIVLIILAYPASIQLDFLWKPAVAGLLVGMTADFLMLIHIAVIAEKVLLYGDEQYANRTTLIHSMIRKVLFVIMILLFWNVPYVNVLAIIFGAMGMKAGAYLQPVIHRFLSYMQKS